MKKEQDHASRRGILRAGIAVIGVGSAMNAGAGRAAAGQQKLAQATEKLAQNIVQYQNTPKEAAKCNVCVNWEPPNACKIVVGPISPEGWCVAYAPKSG